MFTIYFVRETHSFRSAQTYPMSFCLSHHWTGIPWKRDDNCYIANGGFANSSEWWVGSPYSIHLTLWSAHRRQHIAARENINTLFDVHDIHVMSNTSRSSNILSVSPIHHHYCICACWCCYVMFSVSCEWHVWKTWVERTLLFDDNRKAQREEGRE